MPLDVRNLVWFYVFHFFSQMTNNCLHAVMQRRTSLSADARDLDPELHASLRHVINPLPEQFLVVPIWHPSEDSICIVACLVDYPQYENSEEYCSHIVSECLRCGTFGLLFIKHLFYHQSFMKHNLICTLIFF